MKRATSRRQPVPANKSTAAPGEGSEVSQNRDERLTIRRSSIDGMGCFSRVPFPARKKFGEFIGERISAREARARVARGGRISICEIDRRWSIDASRSGSPTAFVNHSCTPNAYARIARGRISFYSLRRIEVGEEITLDYRPSLHPERRCRCGSIRCRGLMG
ncbi:MAG: SET domain-containing protein-lysine N-methyltransferase [Chthoniobacterales bacterium]|nr:SET domain-containing protein-lysine N-methyltransferase [Chthoniobacterales bacterium]